MADNITVDTLASSPDVKTDDDGTAHWPYVKLAFGADNTQTIVDSISSNPLPVALSATDNAVLDQIEVNTSYGDSVGGGTEAAALRVTIANDSTGLVSVDDNGGALTVDWAGTAPPIGAGTEAAALRVTVATDSTGVLSVDDNGGALTVDNAGTFVVQEDGAALTALQLIDNIVQVEDVAHSGGDSGVMALVVRNDELAALAGTDGDYAPLQVSAAGALIVTGSPSAVTAVSISAAGSGDNTLLAAQGAGNKIRVHSLFYVSAGTTTVAFEDGAAGTALTGDMSHIAFTGVVLPYNPDGWFTGGADTLLNMELSAAIQISGGFTYSVVT